MGQAKINSHRFSCHDRTKAFHFSCPVVLFFKTCRDAEKSGNCDIFWPMEKTLLQDLAWAAGSTVWSLVQCSCFCVVLFVLLVFFADNHLEWKLTNHRDNILWFREKNWRKIRPQIHDVHEKIEVFFQKGESYSVRPESWSAWIDVPGDGARSRCGPVCAQIVRQHDSERFRSLALFENWITTWVGVCQIFSQK